MSSLVREAGPRWLGQGAGTLCDSLRTLALVLARILLVYCELHLLRCACIAWSGPPVMMAPSVFQRAKSPQPAHNAQSQQPVPRFLVGGEAPEGSSGNSMSDTENFECFGEGADADVETSKVDTGSRSPPGAINRHSWTRTSLRRTPPSHENLPNRRWGSMRHSGKRQIGSNVLASQLYRSSSFNSSGCGSAGEPADDMYSDVSLEEDVQGLNYKVHQLQQQVSSLADCQSTADERYTRAKAENAVLQARVHILEEQLRELEVKYEERIAEEQKRWREALSRLERDRDQQVDLLSQRLNAAESEAGNLKQEVGRLKGVAEGLRMGADADARRYRDAQDSMTDLNQQLQQAREAERKQRELNASTASLVAELQSEVERLRREQSLGALPTTAPDVLRLEELHRELNELRQENKYLSESHEELQAQLLTRGIEEGRSLLNGVNGPLTNGIQNSLAHELEEMTNDQLDGCHAKTELAIEYDKMQKALKEQQDVNVQLRTYIDTILLSIVENYPQLLEVKHKQAT